MSVESPALYYEILDGARGGVPAPRHVSRRPEAQPFTVSTGLSRATVRAIPACSMVSMMGVMGL